MKSIATSLKHRSLHVVIQIKEAVLHLDQHCEKYMFDMHNTSK